MIPGQKAQRITEFVSEQRSVSVAVKSIDDRP
jgi:hypothetical protein